MFTELLNNGQLYIQKMDLAELTDSYVRPLHERNKQYASQCIPESNGYGDSEWYGGIRSCKDAENILKAGWAEGAAKALRIKEKLEGNVPRAKSRRRKQIWSGEGESLDVDRALMGQWDSAWRSTRREMIDGSNTCVTLQAAWGGNCTRTSEELFWSGAVMLVLSDLLEMAGYSTGINAVMKNNEYNYGKLAVYYVTIKEHGEPLRPDALAGVICHAGIFRTYGFRTVCNAPWNVGAGLGHMADWGMVDACYSTANYKEDNTVIRINDCYNEKAALEEIKRILASIQGNNV